MLEVKAENKIGEVLDFHGNANYILMDATGVTPPGANINTSGIATKDGSVFNSSRVENRNIVLTILPVGSVEANRINLYKYFKTKQWVKLYFKTATRNTFINGYVETMETALFSNQEQMQVSVICPDPYLMDVKQEKTDMNEGHFSPINDSDIEVGFIAEFTFSGNVTGIQLRDVRNNYFGINYLFGEHDVLRINTLRGEKGIWLYQGSTRTNLINYLDLNSQWLQLEPGFNDIAVTITSGSLEDVEGTLYFRKIYEGV